jgi:predicted phosphodiesterase
LQNGEYPNVKTVRENVRGGNAQISQIYSAFRKLELEPTKERIDKIEKENSPFVELPESPIRNFDNYPEIEAGCLVLSDLHFPYHDKNWIERCVVYARKQSIRRLVIGGDLLDFTNVSRHGMIPNYDTDREVDYAQKFFKWAKQYFDEIFVFPGNHDSRASKKLDGQLTTKKLLQLIVADLGTVYEHHHANIGKTWMTVHPANYSKVAAKVSLDLIAKFHKNVASHHTHKLSMAFDPSGKYLAIETGGCFDPAKVAYTHIELSSFPAQMQGALIIHEDESYEHLHDRVKF